MTDPSAPSENDARMARLAHDLRTPLAIIAGFTELLMTREESLSAEQRRDYIERVRAAGEEMRVMLDDERAERLAREGA